MKSKKYFIDNLDRALEEKWIRVLYQPIVRSTNGKICAQEALSRWIDPGGEIYVPDTFIPALDEAGLTYRLDLYVVDQILEKLRTQKEMGMMNLRQSFNLSGKDFSFCDMPEELRKRADAAGIPRGLLALEIGENMITGDYSFIKEQVDRLHELGFQVWLDRFGSAFFSLTLLEKLSPHMIKFDMNYIRQSGSLETGRIILSELMKLAIGLGIDTVCEGVETEEEERFLREIGCDKLQGYLYGEAISFEEIRNLFRTNTGIPTEDQLESIYYDEIGRINLYDLSMLMKKEEGPLSHYFNMIPMTIMEINGNEVEFVRTNQAYRDFVNRIVGHDVVGDGRQIMVSDDFYNTAFLRYAIRCCKNKDSVYINEKLPNRAVVRSFIRYLADNPLTGAGAVAVAVLSVTDAEQETTYENIARALAADYFTLFYVDLTSDSFVEYRSKSGEEELTIERNGTDFFETMRRDAQHKVLDDDLGNFLFFFTKENILASLEAQGTFTMTFRMIIGGGPMKVSLKARRMQPGDDHIILGINIIDEQARLEKGYERKVISSALSGTDAARLESLSLDAASFAVKSCIKLMGPGDFRGNVRNVLTDIMELSQADSARIMLVDSAARKVLIFEEINREGCFPNRAEQIRNLRYEVIGVWENLIGENNAIIVENEEDREELEKKCPEWAQMMKRDGSTCHVLVPLRRKDRILGYLYVLNYNTRKTERIREMIELVSYFLASEITNYMFRKELEALSNFDQLTGLKNRHSMLHRIGEIEKMPSCCFGALTMDLNGLKKVNDTLGHMAGDEMIQNAADMLRDEFGTEELYRIGGDEFIVIFPNISEKEFAERIEKFREGRLKESGVSMALGTSWSATNEETKKVFLTADQNMYANKKAFYESIGGK